MFMEKKIDRTNALISIQDLLLGRDADFNKAVETNPRSIKLVRHSDKVKKNSILGKEYEGKSVYDLYRLHYPKFLEWQCEQNPKYMKQVHYLVVFIGEEQCTCRFIGVFKNNGPAGTTKEGVRYKLEEVKSDGFDLLKNQVVIEWGKSTQQFMHNWTTTKEVIQMYKAADTSGVPYFTRYEDILLDYSQLKKVVKDKEWKSKLEACNCVYVIADKKTGQQYVGVTYKNSKKGLKAGIWSRWSEYADNGHGGDIKLKELCTNNHKYAENYFQWSILEILPLNVIPKVAIDRETKWKDKLLSREFGYNNN